MGLKYTSVPGDMPRGTLTQLFFEAIDAYRDENAFTRFVGDGPAMEHLTYGEVLERVRAAADGLRAAGLGSEDRVAILAENCPEWALADYGALCARIQDVPIHSTLTPEQVAYILNDSGARLVFAADEEQMQKVVEARSHVGHEVLLVVFDAPAELPEGAVSWDAHLERGRALEGRLSEDAFREHALSADPDDLATILYTSGTTGNPKGVMLSHDNLFSNVRAADLVLAARHDDVTLSFLPLSHVFQRMVDYLHFWKGVRIAYARSVYTVADDIKVVRPSIVCAVPRLYEKVYAGVRAATGVKKLLVDWAAGVAMRWSDTVLSGRTPGGLLKLQHGLADKLVYSKVRAAVGGNLRYFVSGSAPLSPKINRFFYGIGLTVLEGYGLTETSPVTNVNTFEDFRPGTVGKAVPGTEIKIADDGEILIRGRQVMQGYYNLPEATAKAIDEEGWFSTGDVGEIDDDGFLRITDRKKDLLKTSGGKYVAPQQIENSLKLHPLVEQAVVVGDGRKFCSVIVVPDFIALREWARTNGIGSLEPAELIRHAEVQEMFAEEVPKQLHGLARHEMPKKIGLISEPFTIEDGTLTPTQKVKRNVVGERYSALVEGFYDEANVETDIFVAD